LVSHSTTRSAPAAAAARRVSIAYAIEREAVEEVLGVEEHALAPFAQERDRVRDDRQVLGRPDAHDLLDMQQRALADQRAGRHKAVGEDPQTLVAVRAHVATAGHAEGDDLRNLQPLLGQQAEELALLRIRRRETGLDQRDAQPIEPFDHAHLLLRG
jgi:hypothetical protein